MQANLSNLAQVRIRFKHNSDWTRNTFGKPFIFKSLKWYSILKAENIEILLCRCTSKVNSIPGFMDKMVDSRKLFDIVKELSISHGVNLYVVTGPYANTVRSILTHNDAVYSDSTIVDGWQKWNVTIPRNRIPSMLVDLKTIGQVESVEPVDKPGEPEKMILFPNSNLDLGVLKLLLGESEFKIIEKAISMGFFLEQRRAHLSDIADMLSKNKSTISRQYRSAINKIMKLVTFNIQLGDISK